MQKRQGSMCREKGHLLLAQKARRRDARWTLNQRRKGFKKWICPKSSKIANENLEKNQWISKTVIKAIKKSLLAGEQSLLFLNRRGYSPLVLCFSCAL